MTDQQFTGNNLHHNRFICTRCNAYFPCKTKLKIHMTRKSPCGIINQDILINEIRDDFACLLDSYNKLEKTYKNIPLALSIISKLDQLLRAIIRYGGYSAEERIQALTSLGTMRDEIASIKRMPEPTNSSSSSSSDSD